jgi:hypothetical protein
MADFGIPMPKHTLFEVDKSMTRAQLKVLAKILDESANEFSNHGCNDFDLDKLGLTPEELESFKSEFTKCMYDDDPQYNHKGNCVQDWLVMRYLQGVAEKEAAEGRYSLIEPPIYRGQAAHRINNR